jgi:ribosomal-protein-alanine N-acetyltransferase
MIGLLKNLLGGQPPQLSAARARDAAEIAALHAASFHRGWSEEEAETLLLDRSVVADRAMAGSRLCGFILSRCATDEAEILSVAVAPNYRGKGVGRDLLNLHLRRLAGMGVRALFLEVDENNSPAIRLYRRAGFHEVGRRPNYYPAPGGKPATALVLRRDIG